MKGDNFVFGDFFRDFSVIRSGWGRERIGLLIVKNAWKTPIYEWGNDMDILPDFRLWSLFLCDFLDVFYVCLFCPLGGCPRGGDWTKYMGSPLPESSRGHCTQPPQFPQVRGSVMR